jgi:hypothetical protein
VSPSEHEYELILSKIRTLVEDGRGETIFEASFKLLSGLVILFYCVNFICVIVFVRLLCFSYYFLMMIEGSGSGRPKNIGSGGSGSGSATLLKIL